MSNHAILTIAFLERLRKDYMSHWRVYPWMAAAIMNVGVAAFCVAAPIPAVVTFDPPDTPQGPSIYVAVPGPQTIVTTPATFEGGVVLGFATFFPAISFATTPNVYGTANFGNQLSTSLTISINPAFLTTEVSFALFNGEVFNQSYVVNAFNGLSVVGSQTLANVAPNFNSGYGLVDLTSLSGITSVTIAPTGSPAVWDFLIDTVAFNQSLTSVITTPLPPVVQPPVAPVQGHRHGSNENETESVEVNFGDDVNDIRGSVLVVTPSTTTPEPATWLSLAGGLALFAAWRRR